jgi:hypothetical protein
LSHATGHDQALHGMTLDSSDGIYRQAIERDLASTNQFVARF